MEHRQLFSDVAALILAGGLGTRLKPVVSDRPKVLAPVLGRPFLFYLLDQLVEFSIAEVVLLTGYRAEQVEQVIDQSYHGMSVVYSHEQFPLGTAGAPRSVLDKITSSDLLLMNGDSYCSVDLAALLHFYRRHNADVCMAAVWSGETERFGRVTWSGDHQITGFYEKEKGAEPGWVNAGVYFLKRSLLKTIPTGCFVSLEKDMMPRWMQTRRLLAYPSSGALLDIGTPQSFQSANDFFRNHRGEAENISATAGMSLIS